MKNDEIVILENTPRNPTFPWVPGWADPALTKRDGVSVWVTPWPPRLPISCGNRTTVTDYLRQWVQNILCRTESSQAEGLCSSSIISALKEVKQQASEFSRTSNVRPLVDFPSWKGGKEKQYFITKFCFIHILSLLSIPIHSTQQSFQAPQGSFISISWYWVI